MRLPWLVSVRKASGRPGGSPAGRTDSLLLRLDDLVEGQLAALDPVSTVIAEGRVAVLVDRVGPQHGLTVLDLEERVDDRLAVVALVPGVLDGLESDAHRLVAVDRVGLGVGAVLRLVVGE